MGGMKTFCHVDSDREPIDYGKEGPLFLPDAKAAILVADPEGKALALSIPETGKFLQGVYGGVRADHDHALATWCANGSLLIGDLGASSFAASLSKKGFLKLKLSFDARNERDAALLRRPLVYYAQRFAADASASDRVPPWTKDLTAHLRVAVKGRTVTVETYCKFRELVSEVKAMASESRR